MSINYEFRTAMKWPVYKQVDYIEKSPPIFYPRRGQDPPPDGALMRGGEIRRMYDPLVEEPQLWLYFENLEPKNVRKMVKFAKKYGFLGLDRFGEEFSTPLHGEYVQDWSKQIITMKAVVAVYRELQRKDGHSLARKFRPHRRSSGLVIYLYDKANSPGGYEDYELVRMGWGWVGLGDAQKPLDTARGFIADLIERRLYGHITPILDISRKEPAAVLNIPSLLGAMYMQIWVAVASREIGKVKRCPSCGRWFKPSRRDQIWCDNYCGSRERMRRYRQRKSASSQSLSA